jgi:hypothetical protein
MVMVNETDFVVVEKRCSDSISLLLSDDLISRRLYSNFLLEKADNTRPQPGDLVRTIRI